MVAILGIETSCDETAAAVVDDGRLVRSNVVLSQEELHRRFGGVVPELASREHVVGIMPKVQAALAGAGGWDAIDAVAVSRGPGLAGSLLVGVNVAKAIAAARGLPLVGVNHLEGHVYATWLLDRGRDPREAPPPQYFRPYRQTTAATLSFYVRTAPGVLLRVMGKPRTVTSRLTSSQWVLVK